MWTTPGEVYKKMLLKLLPVAAMITLAVVTSYLVFRTPVATVAEAKPAVEVSVPAATSAPVHFDVMAEASKPRKKPLNCKKCAENCRWNESQEGFPYCIKECEQKGCQFKYRH